jgi:hypothetical protein
MKTIKLMRERLQPKGRLPLVRLELRGAAMFDHDFVNGCITRLQTRLALARAGLDEPLNELERLALHVLLDSAYLSPEELS